MKPCAITSIGPQGPTGPDGDPGPEGPAGAPGPKGIKGFSGRAPYGPGGDKGEKGQEGGGAGSGPPGDKGPVGGSTPGGTKGPQGSIGPQGAQGPASDRRLKDNIKGLKGNMAKLLMLKGLYFDWKQDEFTLKYLPNKKGTEIGFIAQDVNQILPDIVFTDDEGVLAIEYEKMVAIGLGSIQEQQTRIDNMKTRINELKNKI